MKKLLFVLTIGTTLALAACGGGDTESTDGASEDVNVESSEAAETSTESTSEVSFEEAGAGDVVTDDNGSYEIVKVAEDIGNYETGTVSFDVSKAFLAVFTPTEGEEFYFEDDLGEEGTLNLVVTLVEAENSGEEYVNFGPFFSDVFIGGSKPYTGQAFLNEGDSEISAGDSQEFQTAYFVEDEDLASVSEVKIVQSAPSSDYRKQGEDVEFTIAFE